jgi:hypothetical protein
MKMRILESQKQRVSIMIMLLTSSVEIAMEEQMTTEATSDVLAQVDVGMSRESRTKDVFQDMRSREVLVNEYARAYFGNVHPLLPVLHKEAFYRLYRLYGLEARSDKAQHIKDASTREGRAVTLICGVLALGALSLVETRRTSDQVDESKENENGRIRHFHEALGFYGVCLRLLTYKHDTLETMIVYLFMVMASRFRWLICFQGVFAIQLTDVKGIVPFSVIVNNVCRSVSQVTELPNSSIGN